MASDPLVPTASAEEIDRWIYKLARQFGLRDENGVEVPPELSPGDRAALRRIGLKPGPMADGVVIKLLFKAGVPEELQRCDFKRWRLIAHAAAVLSGTGKRRAHSGNARLGEVLKAAGYSENRLLRLLASRGQTLTDQAVRAIRVIAQKGEQPVNLRTLYHLLSDWPAEAEAARVRIAQDYQTAEARSEQETSSDD